MKNHVSPDVPVSKAPLFPGSKSGMGKATSASKPLFGSKPNAFGSKKPNMIGKGKFVLDPVEPTEKDVMIAQKAE